jgi:16S rRNA (cytosine1402-N4)-methyltransferase
MSDATLGTGGHAIEIARRLTTGRLVGLDRDPQALEIARERLGAADKVTSGARGIFEDRRSGGESELPPFDGVIADLGISSLELDSPERGFSFRWAAPLDMRMNPDNAADSGRHCESLAGERTGRPPLPATRRRGIHAESPGRSFARVPYGTPNTWQRLWQGLRKARGRQKLHPATKTFLALRTAVNREEEELGQFLSRAPATFLREDGGSSSVITRWKTAW